jgi:hypothetical protein
VTVTVTLGSTVSNPSLRKVEPNAATLSPITHFLPLHTYRVLELNVMTQRHTQDTAAAAWLLPGTGGTFLFKTRLPSCSSTS